MGGTTILVTGLLPHDSGKTTFTLMLSRALRDEGLKVAAMKPIAAHSAWYQPWSLAESMKLGVLVGGDVVKYLREGLISNPDIQNPVDILTAPPDPTTFPSASAYLNVVESLQNQVVMARLSIHGRTYYVVPEVIERLPRTLKTSLKPLLSIMRPSTKVGSKWLITKLMSPEVGTYVLAAAMRLRDSSDVLIVESFNNALIPVVGLENLVKVVIVVAPGKAMVFNGSKLRAYLSGTPRYLWEVTSNFVNVARPDDIIDIPLAPAHSREIPSLNLGKLLKRLTGIRD